MLLSLGWADIWIPHHTFRPCGSNCGQSCRRRCSSLDRGRYTHHSFGHAWTASRGLLPALSQTSWFCLYIWHLPLQRAAFSLHPAVGNSLFRSHCYSKRATVSDSLSLLFEKERPWANRSLGCLKKGDRKRISLFAVYKRATVSESLSLLFNKEQHDWYASLLYPFFMPISESLSSLTLFLKEHTSLFTKERPSIFKKWIPNPAPSFNDTFWAFFRVTCVFHKHKFPIYWKERLEKTANNLARSAPHQKGIEGLGYQGMSFPNSPDNAVVPPLYNSRVERF